MLLLATLLGLVILSAAVAVPPFREGAAAPEDDGPVDAWTNGPVWIPRPLAAAGDRCCESGTEVGAAGPELAAEGGMTGGARVGESRAQERLAAAVPDGGEDCLRGDARPSGDDAAEKGAQEDATVIADFDPAVETIEIAYAGAALPDLRFVEAAGATEVLVDGVVVARMAGVTGLGPSHVSLIAA